MSNSLTDSQNSEQDKSINKLVWTIHLAKHEPLKLVVTVLACFAAGVIGYLFIHNPFPIIIMLAIMIAALSDFLLPVTYRVGPLGASSTSLLVRRTIRWEEVKACYLDDSGIKLSSIGHPSRREALHGVYLRFGEERDAVIEMVKALRRHTDDRSG